MPASRPRCEERTRDLAQSMNELAQAHSTVQQQAGKLQEQTEQLKDWNKSLEERVEKQLAEIERIRKLERFLAPQVAQLIASSDGHDSLLDSHRREVTVVFCDLRGFTAFTEATEPEEAMNVLREYHAALGELTFKYEGTLDRYAGDGVMILFNAPIELSDHTRRAVKMAVEMRDAIGALTVRWRNRGHSLGFGVGIALGYATIGQVGFEQRWEYSAIGSVTNLASRLCDEAKANQIVVSRRVYGMVEPWVEGRPLDDLNLKGFNHPILAAEILRWREENEVAEAEPAEATASADAARRVKRITLLSVVPAKRLSAVARRAKAEARAGTHNHRPSVVARKPSNSASQRNRHGVWVPAVAGTTRRPTTKLSNSHIHSTRVRTFRGAQSRPDCAKT